jgi:Fe-S protein assembly co-chaperone HscB
MSKFKCFSMFQLAPSFKLDKSLLKQKFLSLQKLHHPDKAHSATHMNTSSSEINKCFETLNSDIQRAKYILSENNLKIPGACSTFLGSVMMEMDDIEEMEDSQIEAKTATNAVEIGEIVKRMDVSYGRDWDAFAQDAMLLNYKARIRDMLRERGF